MNDAASPADTSRAPWKGAHIAALLTANVAIAFGPWWVRLSDVGPVATAFWRCLFALPILLLLLRREGGGAVRAGGAAVWIALGAGAMFAFNMTSAYHGIALTRLGNVALFGNSGGLLVLAWGLVAARRFPHRFEVLAIASALLGGALLLGSSLRVSMDSLNGDLLSLLAGAFYATYILMLRPVRADFGQFTLLFWATLSATPILLLTSLSFGETILSAIWWPMIVLMLSSHVIGQGLLVYSLPHFSPLVIGLALLTQPAISATIGWLAFDEALGPVDVLGMGLMAAALVIARIAGEFVPAKQ